MNHKQQTIKYLVTRIKKKGFRVFISKCGTYGFYTNDEGTKIISFQTEFSHVTFSGNYKTNKPLQTGNGWRIVDNDTRDYINIFQSFPPQWAIVDSLWKYTALKQHLDFYQESSGYVEVME